MPGLQARPRGPQDSPAPAAGWPSPASALLCQAEQGHWTLARLLPGPSVCSSGEWGWARSGILLTERESDPQALPGVVPPPPRPTPGHRQHQASLGTPRANMTSPPPSQA